MHKYQNQWPSSQISTLQPYTSSIASDRPIYQRKQFKTNRYTHNFNTLHSMDSQPINIKIPSKPQRKLISKQVPGVGQYDISIPIVKPAYQTYEKSNEVVLVKINHIGGTASFRNEQDRFNQNGQSIYIPSLTPGPGTYNSILKPKPKYKQNKPYNQSYSIIHDIIMQNRQTIQSIPNYSLPSKAELKYNGMPRHLQDMYHKLGRAKILANNYRNTSLQLNDLLRLRQQLKQMPMKQVEQPQTFVYLQVQKQVQKQVQVQVQVQKGKSIGYIAKQRLTQTMYRFEEQKKKQTQRARKIQVILSKQKKRSFSAWKDSMSKYNCNNISQNGVIRHRYNRNMVNILFGQKSKQQQHIPTNKEKQAF